LLVVDDGSTDDTQTVLQPYMERIRYMRQEHRGVAVARNWGIREAKGTFVAFLDSDDVWEEAALETLLEALQEEEDVALAASANRLIRQDGELLGGFEKKRSPGPYFTTRSLLGSDFCLPGQACRKSCFDACGLFDEALRIGSDLDLWLRLSMRFRLRYLETPLVRRRLHDANLISDSKKFVYHLRIVEKFAREHPEYAREHPWVLRKAFSKLHERIARHAMLSLDGEASHGEARRHLRYALRQNPFRGKLYVLYGFSYCPGWYKRWKARGR
jgi:glycosyltransferase involved in cell wall biosynthesis